MTASGQYRSFQGFPWSLNWISSITPGQALEDLDSGDRVVPDSSSLVSGKGVDPPKTRKVMGRGKIEIKKIENPTSRQVTFSKRRGGLMKKGHELAVLCDADVAVIIFSSSGKMFEFASSGSMRNILERYSKCPDGAQIGGDCDFMGREVVTLRQQLERLQDSQRHLLGENLQGLTIPDLLQLEKQLDTSASRVRAQKNQLLLEEVEDLRRKEKAFLAANEDLRQKLANVKKMTEAAAPAGTSEDPSQLVVRIPTQYEAGGSSAQQAATLYPTAHPNLRDPQTSQTSLHLGLFPESLMPSTSRRTSQQSPTEQGESSMRWEHPHYRSQQ